MTGGLYSQSNVSLDILYGPGRIKRKCGISRDGTCRYLSQWSSWLLLFQFQRTLWELDALNWFLRSWTESSCGSFQWITSHSERRMLTKHRMGKASALPWIVRHEIRNELIWKRWEKLSRPKGESKKLDIFFWPKTFKNEITFFAARRAAKKKVCPFLEVCPIFIIHQVHNRWWSDARSTFKSRLP